MCMRESRKAAATGDKINSWWSVWRVEFSHYEAAHIKLGWVELASGHASREASGLGLLNILRVEQLRRTVLGVAIRAASVARRLR